MIRSFTVSDFKHDVLDAERPVLVDFSAAWCGPCQMLAPVLDQVGREFAGSHVIGKVDIDHDPVLAEAFDVSSVPTLVLFQGGQPVRRLTGFHSAAQLRAFLNQPAAA